MNDAGKEMMLQAIALLLDDPVKFRREYKQPMGEHWKHILWKFAEEVDRGQQQQKASELTAWKSERAITDLDTLVLFIKDHLVADGEQLENDFADLDQEHASLKQQVEHLRVTLRAVEETLNRTVERLDGLDQRLVN